VLVGAARVDQGVFLAEQARYRLLLQTSAVARIVRDRPPRRRAADAGDVDSGRKWRPLSQREYAIVGLIQFVAR